MHLHSWLEMAETASASGTRVRNSLTIAATLRALGVLYDKYVEELT